ncbi:hypothetical protein BU23DRAFT_555096 [Bimuria novae-zelandiae CBS 107.79]|uniref:Large ribosomal subunit protein mL67 n=1 Tax=Bimuria novae-zelandiae CBS 107.79 TaxID=1447943 RepID=A0A6A5V6W0_9PLEO|nr:hypothetical protein BU23DRAFT_555096 [Bimuria novae-zelandiae CBS 107.79]
MPRNLAKLRFRVPRQLQPPNLNRLITQTEDKVHRALRAHVLDYSKPQTSLSIQVAVNSRWKQQPGKKKTQNLAYKPHTVKDLIDPEGTAKHGQIIYVFANVKTGQVIYSLVELLDNYHLDQLPFLGKHSKPPALRPDDWKPHCVVTFPDPEQGLQAFRKLREFRRLHETSWDKTNPEWRALPAQARMRKIMDQVANTSADLAEVLSIQQRQSGFMRQRLFEREKKALGLMKKMWAETEALAKGDQNSTNPEWLKQQINSLKAQLGKKRDGNEADVKRLEAAKKGHETRLRRVLRARKCMKQLNEAKKKKSFRGRQKALRKVAAPAMVAGAQDRLRQLKEGIALERKMSEQSEEDTEQTLAKMEAQLRELEDAFLAKMRVEAQDDPVTRAILPGALKRLPPRPFPMGVEDAALAKMHAEVQDDLDTKLPPRPSTLGIEIKWVDLRNAEYAAGNWPRAVVHDALDLRSSRQGISFLNPEQYQISIQDELQGLVTSLERQALEAQGLLEPEPEPEPEKTGVWKYLPELKNPFQRAEA